MLFEFFCLGVEFLGIPTPSSVSKKKKKNRREAV